MTTNTDPRNAQLRAMQDEQEKLGDEIGEKTDGIDILSLVMILAPELDFKDYTDFLDSRLYAEILGTQSNSELTDALVRKYFTLDNAISDLDDDITLGE